MVVDPATLGATAKKNRRYFLCYFFLLSLILLWKLLLLLLLFAFSADILADVDTVVAITVATIDPPE